MLMFFLIPNDAEHPATSAHLLMSCKLLLISFLLLEIHLGGSQGEKLRQFESDTCCCSGANCANCSCVIPFIPSMA